MSVPVNPDGPARALAVRLLSLLASLPTSSDGAVAISKRDLAVRAHARYASVVSTLAALEASGAIRRLPSGHGKNAPCQYMVLIPVDSQWDGQRDGRDGQRESQTVKQAASAFPARGITLLSLDTETSPNSSLAFQASSSTTPKTQTSLVQGANETRSPLHPFHVANTSSTLRDRWLTYLAGEEDRLSALVEMAVCMCGWERTAATRRTLRTLAREKLSDGSPRGAAVVAQALSYASMEAKPLDHVAYLRSILGRLDKATLGQHKQRSGFHSGRSDEVHFVTPHFPTYDKPTGGGTQGRDPAGSGHEGDGHE